MSCIMLIYNVQPTLQRASRIPFYAMLVLKEKKHSSVKLSGDKSVCIFIHTSVVTLLIDIQRFRLQQENVMS
jgi:hypothetical protein